MVYFYKKKIPNVDEIIIGRIDKITELGIDVSLVEYDNIKGYISYSEVSRKKKFNINKILTVGKEVHLIVINVDTVKGYIDLSKRTINEEEIKLFDEKYKKYMHLYSIFKYFYFRYYQLKNISDEKEFENFLDTTLWKYQETYDNETILDKITNSDTIMELLNLTNDLLEKSTLVDGQKTLNVDKLKGVVDEYIRTKIILVKPSKEIIFNLCSLERNGLYDLKYAMDYKNFYFYPMISDDYTISIIYDTNSEYKITINQNDFSIKNQDYDIHKLEENLIDEISKRSTEKNMIFNYKNI
jgi:translation initiation factor 2 alpha subunit (eIF-2alpha)